MDALQDSLVSWLSLIRDNRFSLMQKHSLLDKFGSLDIISQAAYKDLCDFLGVRVEVGRDKRFRESLRLNLKRDLDWLRQDGNHLICWGDANYPKLLTEISDPPLCLFASGDLSLLSEPKISVVGSRRPSPAGIKITKNLSSDLSKLGIVITSGMALGIDAVSHQSALDVSGGTIAVMGCGLDIITPLRNRRLFEKINQQGLMLSEYPVSYPASRYTFPQRNRIVSGLSYGVIIVEAAQKSGTLITARMAMEQNREVFVVPGSPVNPQYAGSNELIRQGALLLANVDDVLVELSVSLQADPALSVFDSLASKGQAVDHPIIRYISYESTPIDQIILESGLTASEVSSMLLILEIEGVIAISDDGGYLLV